LELDVRQYIAFYGLESRIRYGDEILSIRYQRERISPISPPVLSLLYLPLSLPPFLPLILYPSPVHAHSPLPPVSSFLRILLIVHRYIKSYPGTEKEDDPHGKDKERSGKGTDKHDGRGKRDESLDSLPDFEEEFKWEVITTTKKYKTKNLAIGQNGLYTSLLPTLPGQDQFLGGMC
jgi:hypothetical protein